MARNTKLIMAASVLLMSASCAKDMNDTANDQQERVLDAYIEKYNADNGTDVRKEASGLTILEYEKGYGQLAREGMFVYADYDSYSLDGKLIEVGDKELAKQMGIYSAGNYYGPTLFTISDGSITEGMKELLTKTTQGSKVKAIIPPWLTRISSANENNKTEQTESENILYDMKIGSVITNMAQFEKDTMAKYVSLRYPDMEEKSDGFYFKSIKEIRNDTIASGTEVRFRYVGKLLDGYVFDTNIADTAKKYNIFDSSRDYSKGLNIFFSETYEGMTSTSDESIDNNTAVLEGVARALKLMYLKEEAVTVFKSEYGYGEEGNFEENRGVPKYQPLVFYLYIEEEVESTD